MKSRKIIAAVSSLFILLSTMTTAMSISAEESDLKESQADALNTAESKTIPYNEINYGDVDQNGSVEITDLSKLSLYLLHDLKLNENALKNADVNADGNTDLRDLAHFKQYLSKDDVTLGNQDENTKNELTVVESGKDRLDGFINQDYRNSTVYIDSYEKFTDLMDKITDKYCTGNKLKEKFNSEFFEKNTVSLCFDSTDIFESADLKNGTIILNYFPFNSQIPLPITYYTYVVFDKDTMGNLDIEKAEYHTNATPIPENSFDVTSFICGDKDVDEWIDSQDDLTKFLDEHYCRYYDEGEINIFAEQCDEDFFKDNGILAFSYDGSISEVNGFYDDTYVKLNIVGELQTGSHIVMAAFPKAMYNNRKVLLNNSYTDVCLKPVIYLYPEKDTDVYVSLDVNGKLTYVYPEFNDVRTNTWKVTAKPDGTLYTDDGSEYNYLFWEGPVNAEWDMSKGFVVKGSDTMKFFKEQLPKMGLKPKEYNDFIVFWGPMMQNNEYNYITFQTDVYTDNAVLSVTPDADSVLRVFMAYTPVNADEAAKLKQTVKEPEFNNFERKGFTVVEWGGTQITR